MAKHVTILVALAVLLTLPRQAEAYVLWRLPLDKTKFIGGGGIHVVVEHRGGAFSDVTLKVNDASVPLAQ